MNIKIIHTASLYVLANIFLYGCAGNVTMPTASRAGDTIVLAAGKKHFERDDLTVTITDAGGMTTIYDQGHSAVRAVINLYPDPLSYLISETRTGGHIGQNYGHLINYAYTDYDPDWWQTTVYLDLPVSMATGEATIDIQSPIGESYSVPVQIIQGQGEPSTFSAGAGNLNSQMLHSMERRPSYTVKFDGTDTIPAAIQIDFSHDPDESVGGTGKPIVINQRGEMKSIAWTDNGTDMRVIISNAGDGTWEDHYLDEYGLKLYKFYITGGITGLQIVNASAYDSNGNMITGFNAYIE